MRTGRRAVIELLLALVAAVGCVLSWLASISTVDVPPIMDNEPWTTSLVYSPPLLALSLLLATVAGVLAVLGVARLRRRRVAPEQFRPLRGRRWPEFRFPNPARVGSAVEAASISADTCLADVAVSRPDESVSACRRSGQRMLTAMAAVQQCDRLTLGGLIQSSNSVTLFHMTELAERPTAADALPLGPESLVWRYFGDNRMYLIGPRPAVLQNMLAELGQGVLDHSVFFADTAARVKRSLPPIFMTVYGADDANEGTRVRDFHRDIKGDMPSQTGHGRYHALDPDTYFWAHATFVDQVLYFADTFVKRLSREEKEQIYLESKTWYRRYGVSDRPMPANYDEFERYWDRMIDEIVVPHQTAKYGVGYVTKGFPCPKGVSPARVADDRTRVQPRRRVPHHRRHAAADPGHARPAVERTSGASLPALRRTVAVAAGQLAVGSVCQ